ncbi:ANTAR domain-containing protein [Actinomycetospora sp. TBRC 11914]|uniref:ANTAR domain-containing protein n=1 Tax=Actinomycetospora sp. TBRC 11914 TaxID=2729387 RepID=UPI00145C5BA0|nr:ANTAR domain-containing protein [Actinomycetospora sp. TBRC 11914]NMO90585.1 ANTAR domain-containing protein [Actinomycetospora sp. TBRC 11914]
MSLDDSGMALAEQATRSLGSLERYGHVLRPSGVDEAVWRLEVLEELAQAGRRLAGAIARVAGDSDPAVAATVRELGSAIELHVDRVVRAVRERPRTGGGDRVVAFPTPYARVPGHGPPPRGSVAPAGDAVSAGEAVAPLRDAAPAVVDHAAQQALIGAAAELLMARLGCGVDAAYALILERAREGGTSTYEIAQRVIDDR